MKSFDSVKNGNNNQKQIGLEENEHSATGIVKGVCPKPALHQHIGNHGSDERDVYYYCQLLLLFLKIAISIDDDICQIKHYLIKCVKF